MAETKSISIPVIGQHKAESELVAKGWKVIGRSASPVGPAFVRVTLQRDDAPAEAPKPPAKPKPVAKVAVKAKAKPKKK